MERKWTAMAMNYLKKISCDQHQACIVVLHGGKRAHYYNSYRRFCKDNTYLKGALWYSYDLDKKECLTPDKWKLVLCAKTIPETEPLPKK